MSKSAENPKGVIKLLDDIDDVRKKIMKAATDSESIVRFDPENKPGVSNLMGIYAALTYKSMEDIEEEFKGQNYGTFKKAVADVVCSELEKIQARYYEILNGKELDRILDEGREKTLAMAKEKYEMMKKKIGLYRG